MSLPTAYLTSFKNLPAILKAIQGAQAPERFTQKFLEGLGFPSSNDRTVINVLKALGFLDESGLPQRRYHAYLDQTQSALVLAAGLRDAYADLFRVNKNAHTMSTNDVKNKMKTLSEGAFTDRVLTQMAGTFTTLVKEADFSTPSSTDQVEKLDGANDGNDNNGSGDQNTGQMRLPPPAPAKDSPIFGSLTYNINLHLPESRDPAVYNALFKALRDHLR
ncbi:MAG: DUF5343 domain-containing protein [Propionicimonas sp.]|uniref:DUF5343 domain-containing protein n=1 Tax=Propionicimonas sp. TaxID=1955623 RepID=UPI003D10EBC5